MPCGGYRTAAAAKRAAGRGSCVLLATEAKLLKNPCQGQESCLMERDGKVEADGKHAVFQFKKRSGYSVTTVLAKALRTFFQKKDFVLHSSAS